MADRARAALKSGFSAILDGVYGSMSEREEAAAAARDSGVPFAGLWLEGAQATLEARVAARRGDASDATVSVLRRQLESVTPPLDWPRIDGGESPSETLRTVRDRLAASAA
jgi:predicted kinase